VPEARSVRYDRWRKIQFESRFAEEAQVGFDSKWDREFESPFLQQAVCLSGERRGCTGKARHFGGILRATGDVRKDVQAANRASCALSL
jgi:hypothetical protein